MKTLIKRLFGITKLENELEATKLALMSERFHKAVAKAEAEGLRDRLVKITAAKPGPWKLTKDKTKRYRIVEWPHAYSVWRTESEPIEQVIPFDWSDDEIKEPDSYLEDRACRGYNADEERWIEAGRLRDANEVW